MDKPISFTFWLATLLSPVAMVISTIVFLMTLDFITYVKSQSINQEVNRKEQVKYGVIKLIIYVTAIVSTHLFEQVVSGDIPILKITIGFIMIAEIKSIAENCQNIYGKDALKSLMSFLKRLWKKESAK